MKKVKIYLEPQLLPSFWWIDGPFIKISIFDSWGLSESFLLSIQTPDPISSFRLKENIIILFLSEIGFQYFSDMREKKGLSNGYKNGPSESAIWWIIVLPKCLICKWSSFIHERWNTPHASSIGIQLYVEMEDKHNRMDKKGFVRLNLMNFWPWHDTNSG